MFRGHDRMLVTVVNAIVCAEPFVLPADKLFILSHDPIQPLAEFILAYPEVKILFIMRVKWLTNLI